MTLSVKFLRLSLPLVKPYVLSFGTVKVYDTFLVILEKDGARGAGESTALPGYSWETVDSIQNNILSWLEAGSMKDAFHAAKFGLAKSPFAASSIITAHETLLSAGRKTGSRMSAQVPLTALLDGSSEQEYLDNAKRLMKLGYKTLKLKVGKDADRDAALLDALCRRLPEELRMRVDANQGCTWDHASRLLKHLSPRNVELLEQPFKPNMWNEMKELNAASPVPLMLDESIWSLEDLEKAASMKASKYIKLKLFKHGGIERTRKMALRARELGLKIVLGNGVQTEISSLYESVVHNECGIESCGEMNGGLKLVKPVSNVKTSIDSGRMSISCEGVPCPNPSEESIVMSKTFSFKE